MAELLPLLPDRLKALWRQVEARQRHPDEYEPLKDQWFAEYRARWFDAMVTQGYPTLKETLLAELGRYVGVSDLAEIERRCRTAPAELAREWDSWVDTQDRSSVEAFYNQSRAEIYGLLWWHTLVDDDTPLSYLLAAEFARSHGLGNGGAGAPRPGYLDFGSGVGSGAVIFRQYGFDVTCADISSPMLEFCRFRLQIRNWPGTILDLKAQALPEGAYDFITAMDVFEHLYDPIDAIERLWRALKPGGYIYGRWAVEEGDERRGHIVMDMGPTHRRMQELGLVKIWHDDWCWGHEVYQKG